MDDSKFDDILKGKLDQIPVESFDPASLADLHYKMALNTSLPWNIRYKAELLTATALIIILLFNGFLFYGINGQTNEKLNLELSEMRTTNAELIEMQRQIMDQSREQIVDTVIITSQYPALVYELNQLKDQLNQLITQTQSSYNTTEESILFLGYRNELSEKMVNSLSKKGMIRYQDDEVYLTSEGYIPKRYPNTPVLMDSYPYNGFGIENITYNNQVEEKPKPQMDFATRQELEKHYMKGVGLRAAPVLGVNFPFYEKGEGSPKVSYGVLADIILSPSLSLETGVLLTTMNNELESSDNLDDLNKPGFDPSLGELSAYEIDTDLVEFPLNLKYRYPISERSFLTGSLGYTAMLYTHQQIEYEQLFDSGDPLGIINVSSGETINTVEFSPGTANISLGISTRLKGRNYLELGAQYRIGLGPMGVEKLENSLLGFRAAYWFHIR